MNRTIMAARAAANPTIGARRSTSIYLGPLTEVEPAARAFRNRKAPRMTGVQRNSIGRRSEWNRSPYYWTNPGYSA